MVKRNLAGGARHEGHLIFVFRVAGVGGVRGYVYKLFRVALCGIIMRLFSAHGAKKPLHTGVRTGCHYLISLYACLSVCPSVCLCL